MTVKNCNLILYRIVTILLVLVIITLSLVSNRFARYATGDLLAGIADVAAFNVKIAYGYIIDNDLTKLYPFTISNSSEVLVGFDEIIVQFQDPLPKNITLSLTDEDGNPLCSEQKTDSLQKEFIFSFSSTLEPHATESFHLKLTQDERGIFDANTYTTRLIVTVYQLD